MNVRIGKAISQAQLAFVRIGGVNVLVLALCLSGLAVWSWFIPELRVQLHAQQSAIESARKSQQLPVQNVVPPRSLAEERVTLFYENLGERRHVEQQLKTLFALASKNQLVLHQAEYKASYDKNGKFHTYQVTLPVKGAYPVIRKFCQEMLLSIPFASLDEMSFKRESIGSQVLETKLRFTMYLSDERSQEQAGVATQRVNDE